MTLDKAILCQNVFYSFAGGEGNEFAMRRLHCARRKLKRAIYSEKEASVYRLHYENVAIPAGSFCICVCVNFGQKNFISIVTPSFKKSFAFQHICRPHENAKPAFSCSSALTYVQFPKAPFSWQSSVNGSQNWRNKLKFCFQISLTLCTYAPGVSHCFLCPQVLFIIRCC